MGDGRGDFQRVWHEFAGRYFDGKSILDVGGGYGYSRCRLENVGRNRVTLQDIDRSLMCVCDIIRHIDDVEGLWDVVTSFDVVEHAVDPQAFVNALFLRAREGVFFTTPSRHLYDHPWHFYPSQIIAMLPSGVSPVLFARYREGMRDEIVEISEEAFLGDKTVYAHGVYARKSG